jgi:hypothetical protein
MTHRYLLECGYGFLTDIKEGAIIVACLFAAVYFLLSITSSLSLTEDRTANKTSSCYAPRVIDPKQPPMFIPNLSPTPREQGV